MLHSYYDCNQSAKFQSLFGKLWIGQHPIESQGKYQVLFLDFSQVSGKQAVEQIRQYAAAPKVEALRQGTTLHKIIMQFEGWNLKRMEEIN